MGYSIANGCQELIVNNGLGANFQVVDMTDKAIQPVRLYWLEMKDPADGPKDGHQIGPEEHYTWTTVDGEKRLGAEDFEAGQLNGVLLVASCRQVRRAHVEL